MNKRRLFDLARSVVAKLAQRELVLLPLANDRRTTGDQILPLRYSYRASVEAWVEYRVSVGGADLFYQLFPMIHANGQPAAGPLCFSTKIASVKRDDVLRVCLTDPAVRLNDKPIAYELANPIATRKYIAELRLNTGSKSMRRTCSHYLPFDNKQIGKDYYFGDDYVDYLRGANPEFPPRLVKQYCQSGRVLDIGCALGVYTQGFQNAGFDAYGIDISAYAIAEAGKRVGAERVRECNPDKEGLPFTGNFDLFWLWDVLEHSAAPKALLQKVTQRCNPGGWLFLHTSNADSLAHLLTGADWEGYSDYSHYGVDQISASSLRSWLVEMGWEIITWNCQQIWFSGIDPVMSRLQDVFHRLPELAMLLSERDLGDFITVVARRR